ncbi:MAG: 30S ribosomal protein S4 [Candidatus Glassbacteria bacterium]
MSRYHGADCKLCRREGTKLFLKGYRCYTEKCSFERRGYPPGMHGKVGGRRRKPSDYSIQLREKQKVKRLYGLLETQFKNYFKKASRMPGITGEQLLISLECRLDNIVYRMGFCPSRKAARQMVRHRHFLVNKRIVDLPSYSVKSGDEIAVRDKSKDIPLIRESIESRQKEQVLNWLEVDFKNFKGRVLTKPSRAEIPVATQEQLIVELYSK